MSQSGSFERETVLWLTLFMGLALIGGGIWLIYLTNGGTVINLFGNSFRSHSVGIVGIFLWSSPRAGWRDDERSLFQTIS